MAVIHETEYKVFLTELGRRIKALRQKHGWSQRDMVIKHGYNDSQWRKYERGGGITLQSLVKLAKLFDVHLSVMLDGVGRTMPATDGEKPAAAAKTSSTEKAHKLTKSKS